MLLAILQVLLLAILVVLLLILALLLGLILIPFYVQIALSKDKAYEARIDISWLRGILGSKLVFNPQRKFISLKLFKIEIVTYTIKAKSAEMKKAKRQKRAEKKIEKQARKKRRERKKRPSLPEIIEQAQDLSQRLSLEALRQVIQFPLSLFSSLKLKLAGEAEIGLADPADTGMLLGASCAAKGAFSIKSFELYPNWDEPAFKGNLTLYMRLWLADIIRIAIKTAFASSIRRIWWPYAKQRLSFFQKVRPQTAE